MINSCQKNIVPDNIYDNRNNNILPEIKDQTLDFSTSCLMIKKLNVMLIVITSLTLLYLIGKK